MRNLLAWLAMAGACIHAGADTPARPISDGPKPDARIQFEFAIFYPEHPVAPPMASLNRQLTAEAGMPRLVQDPSKAGTEPVVHVKWIANALKDYAPPSPDMLRYFGRGLTPAQADALSHSDEVLRVDFAHPGADRMRALRNAQVLVERVARDTHGLVWDDETREMFTPDAWHERRVLGWAGDVPEVARHTVIHVYPEGALYRCITLGMAKFGEPDLVVDDLIASDGNEAANVMNVLSQALVEGATADADGQLLIRLQQSAHPAVNKVQGKDLKANAQRSARLLLVQGVHERGDPDNRLVRIAFDRYQGPDEHARQSALLADLYGSTDAVTHIHHDERLLAARDAARARLPALRETFNRGLAPGEYVQVKAPFATDSGGREWMWVEVTTWKGDRIEGSLQNTPDVVKRLHAGQDVVVSQAELFDYIFHHADGHDEGNTTGDVIREQAAANR